MPEWNQFFKNIGDVYQGRTAETRLQGCMIARVVDNVDPFDQHRVRISYPSLADQYTKDTSSNGEDAKIQSPWVRIANLMAGDDFGSLWLPEIDDEVLVAFEDGDMAHPYIVGSLWNGGDRLVPKTMTYTPDQIEVELSNNAQGGKNDYRLIRSRMGHHIAFIDKEGKGGISLRSKKSAELYIDDEDGKERIRLYDKDQKQWLEIDTVNKKITLETDTGDILIKAAEKIRLECKNLEVDASDSITVDAGTSIKTTCQTLNAKASSSMDVNGGTKIKMSATRIDLNP